MSDPTICIYQKPKIGTWYFNKPQETLSYKEYLKLNSHKRKKTNAQYAEKSKPASIKHQEIEELKEEIETRIQAQEVLQEELKHSNPAVFAPLHKEVGQTNPYFTVSRGYGV